MAQNCAYNNSTPLVIYKKISAQTDFNFRSCGLYHQEGTQTYMKATMNKQHKGSFPLHLFHGHETGRNRAMKHLETL